VRFGILHSSIHRLWSTSSGNRLGVGNDPRYNATVTFQTFPFPDGLTPDLGSKQVAASPHATRIASAAVTLHELREKWLNPSELTKREPEVVPGYPERILPKGLAEAEQLKKRTLTALYNQRPIWLAHAHRDLDRAVAAAYGWPESLADAVQPENTDGPGRLSAEEDILKRLLALNRECTGGTRPASRSRPSSVSVNGPTERRSQRIP
jgi:type II restriction/modification system DNA methylase subunit YeeA